MIRQAILGLRVARLSSDDMLRKHRHAVTFCLLMPSCRQPTTMQETDGHMSRLAPCHRLRGAQRRGNTRLRLRRTDGLQGPCRGWGVRHNNPTGKSGRKSVQPFAEKHSASVVGQISDLTPRVSPDERGVAQRHERAVRCGGRDGSRKTSAVVRGRRSRVVPAPRRWR